MRESIHRLVERLSSKIETAEVAVSEAYWESQIEASEENDRRRTELEMEVSRIKGDPESLEAVLRALDEEIHDETLRRQLEVLRMSLTANQMSDAERTQIVELASDIESDFVTHRAQVRGERVSDNDIEEILISSNDEDLRRETWYGSKTIGGITAERVVELVRVRNEVARNLGFADYYRMELDLQEIEEGWLFGVMDQLEELTSEPFGAWKSDLDAKLAERFGTQDLMPWHYADPFFQQLPPDGRVTLDGPLGGLSAAELAAKTFSAWGIDLTKVIERSDLYPRENKCQHAFCIDIDRRGDVRMLCNIVPGERWVEVMLHESGHAAYDIAIDPDLPYLLRRPSHIFVTEAIAIASGRLARDPRWLESFAGLDESALGVSPRELAEAVAVQSLQFARWGLVMVHFERELYSDPEGDLDARWWDLVERFQLLSRPEPIPEGGWASKIHLAAAPVYYHNYLLGELLASQLRQTLEAEEGGFAGVPAVGKALTERVFQPGNLQPWPEVVRSATGQGLSAEAYARDLARAAGA